MPHDSDPQGAPRHDGEQPLNQQQLYSHDGITTTGSGGDRPGRAPSGVGDTAGSARAELGPSSGTDAGRVRDPP